MIGKLSKNDQEGFKFKKKDYPTWLLMSRSFVNTRIIKTCDKTLYQKKKGKIIEILKKLNK
jgi:hypothetical protein